MFKLVRKRKAHFPGLLLARGVWDDIGKVATAGISQNVKDSRQADGKPLKQNPAGYAKYKAEMGWGERALVKKNKSFIRDTGAFRSFVYELGDKKITILPVDKQWKGAKIKAKELTKKGVLKKRQKTIAQRFANFRRDIVPGVQAHGYVGWFGLSAKTIETIRAVIRKFIKKQFAEAARKSA